MTIPLPPAAEAVPRSRTIRVLNGLVLALIGVSVVAQSLAFALAYAGPAGSASPTIERVLGLLGFTILPGVLLALAKLIVNLVRCFSDSKAGAKVAIYGAVVVLPFVLPVVLVGAASRAHAPLAEAQGMGVLESEQFLAGAEWARVNQPLHNTQCKGSQEFRRGCWHTIDLRRKAQRAAGYEWASKHRPEKAALCQGAPYFALGCRTYLARHLARPPATGKEKYEGMTTAECKEAVNANFEAARAIDLEHENFHSIAVTARRNWAPALADCENYDKLALSRFAPGAEERLFEALDKVRAGLPVGDDENAAVLRDFTLMSSVPRTPQVENYRLLFNEYLGYPDAGRPQPETARPSR